MNKLYQEIAEGTVEPFYPKVPNTCTVEPIVITPPMARYILTNYNPTNRNTSNVVIHKYASDMREGKWKTSPQTISFNKKKNLIDGQHRLLAVALTGIPQTFFAAYGFDEDVFEIVDNGKIRTNADILAMKGYSDSATLSSLVRTIISYNFNRTVEPHRKFGNKNQITKSQVIEYLANNPSVVKYVDRYKKSQILTNSIASFCYWLLANVDEQKAGEYLDKVFLGYNLEPNTIESYVHSKLQRNRNAQMSKLTRTAVIANVILGWRKSMGYSKSKVLQINWNPDSPLPTPFPKTNLAELIETED